MASFVAGRFVVERVVGLFGCDLVVVWFVGLLSGCISVVLRIWVCGLLDLWGDLLAFCLGLL